MARSFKNLPNGTLPERRTLSSFVTQGSSSTRYMKLSIKLLLAYLVSAMPMFSQLPTNSPPPPGAQAVFVQPVQLGTQWHQLLLEVQKNADVKVEESSKRLEAAFDKHAERLRLSAESHREFVEMFYLRVASFSALILAIVVAVGGWFVEKGYKIALQRIVEQAKEATKKHEMTLSDKLSAIETSIAVTQDNLQAIEALGYVQAALPARLLWSEHHPKGNPQQLERLIEKASSYAKRCLALRNVSEEYFRGVGILLGRLHRGVPNSEKPEDLRSAIAALSAFITEGIQQGRLRSGSMHHAALLYNRACYRNVLTRLNLIEKEEKATLVQFALADLSQSCEFDSSNRDEAKKDPDLLEIREKI